MIFNTALYAQGLLCQFQEKNFSDHCHLLLPPSEKHGESFFIGKKVRSLCWEKATIHANIFCSQVVASIQEITWLAALTFPVAPVLFYLLHTLIRTLYKICSHEKWPKVEAIVDLQHLSLLFLVSFLTMAVHLTCHFRILKASINWSSKKNLCHYTNWQLGRFFFLFS